MPAYLEYIPLSTLRSPYGKVLTEGYISRFFVVKRNKNYYDSPRESYVLGWGRDTFCEVILNYKAKKIARLFGGNVYSLDEFINKEKLIKEMSNRFKDILDKTEK